ncbi:MAG: hypothetical protein M3P70_14230 [Actinomycetota bacterium]|nr:hypothetical protein [Actinomycetota bacterium]
MNPTHEREREGIGLPDGRRLRFVRNQRLNCGGVTLVTSIYEDGRVRVRLFRNEGVRQVAVELLGPGSLYLECQQIALACYGPDARVDWLTDRRNPRVATLAPAGTWECRQENPELRILGLG